MRLSVKYLTLISLLSSLLLSSCHYSDGVQGAYPPKAPHFVEGAAVGGVTTAIAGGLAVDGGKPTLALLVGAMLGASFGSYYDSEGLIKKLERHGIHVIRLGDIVEVVIPSDFIFAPNDTEILRGSNPYLDQLIYLLKQYGDVKLIITAHSDDVGSYTDRTYFSRLQAQSVTTYFWTHGINLNRMDFYGVGDVDTSATLRTPNGSAYNRRIDIVLWRHDKPSVYTPFFLGGNGDCWTGADMSTCRR